MKEVKVGKYKIHVKGLFSKEPIKKGDLITKVHAAVKINPELTKFIPNEVHKPLLNIVYTNSMVYQLFELTKEEIEYVESNVE
jgi:hypothetical protein